MIPTVEELNAHLDADHLPETTCLICLNHVPVGMGISVITRHRIDKNMTVACRGSSYVSAQNDGRDPVRVTAIQAHHGLMKDIGEMREEMINGLTARNWRMANVVAHYGERLIRLETRAGIWHELALHGDLALSLRETLRLITRNSTGTLTTHDVDQATVAGHHDWLTEARDMLLELIHLYGVAASLLENLLTLKN